MMAFKDTVVSDLHWHWIQEQSGEDILGMVMDFENGRKTAGELMDAIAEHCQLSFRAGIREVVEWIKQEEHLLYVPKENGEVIDNGILLRPHKWQAKLKVWFKDNPELLKEWGL